MHELTINLDKHKYKTEYYYSCKTRLMSQLETRPTSHIWLTIDLS